jgi:hypothetical protein
MTAGLIFDVALVLGMLLTQLPPVNPMYGYIQKYVKRDLHARTGAFYQMGASLVTRMVVYYMAVSLSFGGTLFNALKALVQGSEIPQNGYLVGLMAAAAALVLLIHLVEGIAGEGISVLIDNSNIHRAMAKIIEIRARMWVQIPIIVFACVSILLMVIRCYLIVTMLLVAG